jgi:hypothetical protein
MGTERWVNLQQTLRSRQADADASAHGTSARRLQAAEELRWMPGAGERVLHFSRPGGWHSVTNFGPEAIALPPGTVVVAPLDHGLLPADTTAWVIADSGLTTGSDAGRLRLASKIAHPQRPCQRARRTRGLDDRPRLRI